MLSRAPVQHAPEAPPKPESVEHQRWAEPFGGTPIPLRTVRQILSLPVLKDIDATDFPSDLPPEKIIGYDGRILSFAVGDVIYDEDDYATSVFILLRGTVRSELRGGTDMTAQTASSWLPDLPRLGTVGSGIRSSAARLFRRSESRRPDETDTTDYVSDSKHDQLPGLLLGAGELFGICSALRRTPRNSTVVVCEDDTVVLEIRWPGIRDLRFWSETFRSRTNEIYQVRSCFAGLRQCALFATLDDPTLQALAERSVFETYGELGWSYFYQRAERHDASDTDRDRAEPAISEQGDHLEGIFVICSGFVRLTHRLNRNILTVGFLTEGDVFGLDQLVAGLKSENSYGVDYGLTACGYADVIWVPKHVIRNGLPEEHLEAGAAAMRMITQNGPGHGADLPRPLLDFIVENRYFNGANAMVINTDRCVNCDDCVRACAATHGNVPRFVRQGKTHHNMMVVNACMHCTDPVCMIDCPTAAIHRDEVSGTVVIDDAACIGCGTCASACPYNNIRMESALNAKGAVQLGADGAPLLRATKCDLCLNQNGGPACKRACPHDAISRVDLEDEQMLSDWLQVAKE